MTIFLLFLLLAAVTPQDALELSKMDAEEMPADAPLQEAATAALAEFDKSGDYTFLKAYSSLSYREAASLERKRDLGGFRRTLRLTIDNLSPRCEKLVIESQQQCLQSVYEMTGALGTRLEGAERQRALEKMGALKARIGETETDKAYKNARVLIAAANEAQSKQEFDELRAQLDETLAKVPSDSDRLTFSLNFDRVGIEKGFVPRPEDIPPEPERKLPLLPKSAPHPDTSHTVIADPNEMKQLPPKAPDSFNPLYEEPAPQEEKRQAPKPAQEEPSRPWLPWVIVAVIVGAVVFFALKRRK